MATTAFALRCARSALTVGRSLEAASARHGNAALERVLLNPSERDLLDRYVGAARNNAKLLQRSINGSSETASLLKHQAAKDESLLTEVLKHGASHVHPVAGLLVHVLPALARAPDTSEALQRTLLSALLDPAAYNRIIGTQEAAPSGLAQLLRGLGGHAQIAVSRPAPFVIPRRARASYVGGPVSVVGASTGPDAKRALNVCASASATDVMVRASSATPCARVPQSKCTGRAT